MESIWKYPLEVSDVQTLVMPSSAEILAVQVQNGKPCLWARVDPDAPKTDRTIITHGTGHAVSEETGEYIGTYQLEEGQLVFHAFEAAGGGQP